MATAFGGPGPPGPTTAGRAGNRGEHDFSSGPYKKRLASGQDIATQVGTMIGGDRLTAFLVCQRKPCGASNPFGQTGAFQIRAKTKSAPSALVYSAGYKVTSFEAVPTGAPPAQITCHGLGT